MPDPVFTGVAAAVVTFFDEHGCVDAATTARHASHLADRGVNAVVVAGTTGEAAHLSMKERLSLLDAVRAAVPGARAGDHRYGRAPHRCQLGRAHQAVDRPRGGRSGRPVAPSR